MISRVNKLNCIIEISRKWASKCRRKVEAHFLFLMGDVIKVVVECEVLL